ncbi:hypothetical protein SRHO_G00177630 [Serrasalmus rhombeus]
MQLHVAHLVRIAPDTELQHVERLMAKANALGCHLQYLGNLLQQWPLVCFTKLGRAMKVHHITNIDELSFCQRLYRVSVGTQHLIKGKMEDMIRKGIIQPSTSPWAAPVVLVPKKDGGTRTNANLKKCNLLQTSRTFLGHMLSREGISTEPSKVEVVQDFPQP